MANVQFRLKPGAKPFTNFHGFSKDWKESVMTYETKTKPALNKLGRATVNGTAAEVKAAADAAVEAGASLNDVLNAVGGQKEWAKWIRRIKKANLV